VVETAVMRKAEEVVNKELDAMQQLANINRLVSKELDVIGRNLEEAEPDNRASLQDQQLKHIAEVRKQINLMLDIAKTLHDAKMVQAFQESVLEEIGQADEATRKRILERLDRRKSLVLALDRPATEV